MPQCIPVSKSSLLSLLPYFLFSAQLHNARKMKYWSVIPFGPVIAKGAVPCAGVKKYIGEAFADSQTSSYAFDRPKRSMKIPVESIAKKSEFELSEIRLE